jgi:hypothetical protein
MSYSAALKKVQQLPRKTRFASVVKAGPDDSAVMVQQQIEQFLATERQEDVLKSVTPVASGGLLLEFKDRRQQEWMEAQLASQDKFQVQGLKGRRPTVLITGVLKGEDPASVRSRLRSQNPPLQKLTVDLFETNFKFVGKRRCHRYGRENWIAEVSSVFLKALAGRRRLRLGLTEVGIEEFFPVTRCYQCQGYGHIAKGCTKERRCAGCGGKHLLLTCRAKTLKCPNCVTAKRPNTGHTASSATCPELLKRMQRCKGRTIYDGP